MLKVVSNIKILTTSKKSKPKNTFTPNSYSHLREVKSTKKSFGVSKLKKLKQIRIKKSFVFVSIFVLLIILFISLALATDIFTVKSFNINTHNNDEVDVKIIKEEFGNKNLFKFSYTDVENYIKNNYDFIEKVYARKLLPNKLEVDIYFQKPYVVISNYKSYAVLDNELDLIEQQDYEEPLSLNEFETKIVYGGASREDDYIKEAYLTNLKEVPEEEFDWEKIPSKEKQKIFEEVSEATHKKISDYKKTIEKSISNTKYKEYPFILFENTNELKDLQYYREEIKLSFKVKEFLKENEQKVLSQTWTNDFTLQNNLEHNKIILFGTIRSLEKQLDDYSSINLNGMVSQYNTFDLRTNKFSAYNR